MKQIDFAKYHERLDSADTLEYVGKVKRIVGLGIASTGPMADIGTLCRVYRKQGDERFINAEIMGFSDNMMLLMPYGDLRGIGIGSRVVSTKRPLEVALSDGLTGRVLDGLGNPIDSDEPRSIERYRSVEAEPPNPLTRGGIVSPIHLGVRCMDAMLTCGQGQRIGIFAGSGVGKSTLLGMIARNSGADVNVIALVGERGREVKEFLDNDLKQEGLRRSVVVVATSDQPALVRVKAALVATTIAEYYRDQGKRVLLMMDSLTRFAMAQREVGLAVGEPPVTRGYTPSVLAMLPRLLERTGCSERSSITAIYTVLVEGDEMNEPISDAVRGILDGHVVLSRRLASANHYPAIDVLSSVSRVMPGIVSREHLDAASEIRDLLAVYDEARDLINIGAYKPGSNPRIDRAIARNDEINRFLRQGVDEKGSYEDTIDELIRLARP